MSNTFMAKSQATFNAPASRVWEALVKPELVKQYLFGTDMEADWRVGGKITYRGEWEGKKHEDKGEVLEFEPNKKIVATYWSGFSGLPDVPENYQKITYDLAEADGKTTLTITQENVKTEEGAKHSEGNWNMVLGKMKEVIEK